MDGRYVNDFICCGSRYLTIDRGNNRLVPEVCLRRRNEPCALRVDLVSLRFTNALSLMKLIFLHLVTDCMMDGRILKREVMVVIDIVLSSYIPVLPEQGREA